MMRSLQPNRQPLKLLTTLILALAVAVASGSTETVDGITWTYTVNGDSVCIGDGSSAAIPTSVSGAVIIPSSLEGKSVTAIADNAFYFRSKITSVRIPEGVVSIGDYAFCGCSELKILSLPKSIRSIGEYAFWDPYMTSGITCIDIPDGLQEIGHRVFYKCSCLTSVDIPPSVTNIGSQAFYLCSNLRTVELHEGVRSFASYAFCNCKSLKTVFLPEGLQDIGSHALYGTALEYVYIPSSVQYIGELAFPTTLAKIDFLGKPPKDLHLAQISSATEVRYNVDYSNEWQEVLAQCGFTNSKPYKPAESASGPYKIVVSNVEWTCVLQDGYMKICGVDTDTTDWILKSLTRTVEVPATAIL